MRTIKSDSSSSPFVFKNHRPLDVRPGWICDLYYKDEFIIDEAIIEADGHSWAEVLDDMDLHELFDIDVLLFPDNFSFSAHSDRAITPHDGRYISVSRAGSQIAITFSCGYLSKSYEDLFLNPYRIMKQAALLAEQKGHKCRACMGDCGEFHFEIHDYTVKAEGNLLQLCKDALTVGEGILKKAYKMVSVMAKSEQV